MTLGHILQGAVAALALALAAGPALAAADVPASEPDDMAMGNANAKVTVIEYASVGCPHCAAWNNTNFAGFKAKVIATGKARYVVREMLTGSPPVATAGWMLARCAAPGRYFELMDAIYERQTDLFKAGAGQVLQEIAKIHGGLDEKAFDACIDDQKGLDAVNARNHRHAEDDKVDSTPTFFVNGARLRPTGELTLAQLGAAIQAARRGH